VEDVRDWPQAIRALLLVWGMAESDEAAAPLLARAAAIGDAILEMRAPVDWPWAHFPFSTEQETVSFPFVADAMEALVQLWEVGAGGRFLGPAQHIAHIFNCQQLPEGCWPQSVHARIGGTLGPERCAAGPMMLMARLDHVLERKEFAGSIERAQKWLLDSNGGERCVGLDS